MPRPGLVALLLAVVVASGCAGGNDMVRGLVPFSIVGPVDRASNRLTVVVERDDCSLRPIVPSAAGKELIVTPTAYVVTVLQDEVAGDCGGGARADPWRAELQLPAPLGRRGFVADAGPTQFREILIPPQGRAAVRSLVLGHRHYIYAYDVCDQVARHLRDVPRDRWCYD